MTDEQTADAMDIDEAYRLIRGWLDGDSDDLRAYEALDLLWDLARAHLGRPSSFGPAGQWVQRGPISPGERQ